MNLLISQSGHELLDRRVDRVRNPVRVGSEATAAGTTSGRLASYRGDGETGALTPLEIHTVGRRPAAGLAVPLSR